MVHQNHEWCTGHGRSGCQSQHARQVERTGSEPCTHTRAPCTYCGAGVFLTACMRHDPSGSMSMAMPITGIPGLGRTSRAMSHHDLPTTHPRELSPRAGANGGPIAYT